MSSIDDFENQDAIDILRDRDLEYLPLLEVVVRVAALQDQSTKTNLLKRQIKNRSEQIILLLTLLK